LSGFVKKSKTITAITSGTYFSKFVIRKNPFQVNMFLIAEDYPLLKINQRIPVHSKIVYSGQNRETGFAEMLQRTGFRIWHNLCLSRVFVAGKEEKLWTITLVQRRGY
jgi:hypothetical protein